MSESVTMNICYCVRQSVRTATANVLLDSLESVPTPLLLEMSHAVVRGEPTAAQLYLDGVLDEILLVKGIQPNATERDKLNIAEIIFHSLKRRPNSLYMINGATEERITNEYILRLAVSIARSISVKCPEGKTVMLLMNNHQRMLATYWATLFSRVLPFNIDPDSTVYELSYFLKLIEPHLVFCDRKYYENVNKANKNLSYKPNVIICDEEDKLLEFIDGFSDDYEDYELPDTTPEAPIMLMPTSGTTGFPKVAILTNRGLVAQLPSNWVYHTHYPKPTNMMMITAAAYWMTFTLTVTSSAVFQIPLLVSPKKLSAEHVAEIFEKFKPTWTFLNPDLAKALQATIKISKLSSLKTIILGGAPVTSDLITTLKAELPNTQISSGYGTTETQGYVSIPDGEEPVTSNGKVINILHYKLLDDNGVEVTPGNDGELYLKGECVIKGYYKNNAAYNESFKDGWYRTGDWMHLDENERLHYLVRRKFTFQFKGNEIFPEEMEAVICAIPGVLDSVVCGTDEGPAAAVVLHPDCTVTREQIHNAINSKFNEYKRLHGGLVFVDNLPRTKSGKLKRGEYKLLINQLTKGGECC